MTDDFNISDSESERKSADAEASSNSLDRYPSTHLNQPQPDFIPYHPMQDPAYSDQSTSPEDKLSSSDSQMIRLVASDYMYVLSEIWMHSLNVHIYVTVICVYYHLYVPRV